MGFLGVYRAIYDYAPQAKGELGIEEGDLLYVLENNDDDGWWKAKKKAGTDDDEEPVGLVPNNYVEEAPPLAQARALFEYTRQTDEELSFPEDALLDVFDTSDPDWILVGLEKEYGFVPSNYIELQSSKTAASGSHSTPAPPALPVRQPSVASVRDPEPDYEAASPVQTSPPPNPAAALAGVMHARAAAQPTSPPPQPARPPATARDEPQFSDDEPVRSPALPSRPRPPPGSSYEDGHEDQASEAQSHRTPGGFHMYNINEMVSVMGKKKKMPTTLGINLLTGIILIAPEKAQDGPSQEWSAEKMTHYSREGKHVFMELVRPSKSIDFHAGAKDTAEEIVSALGELAGAVRAEGLREVIMAGTQKSQRRGQVLYDFMAQGDDEVTVAAGDEVIIVDDSKSEEWWQVRRLKNGKEGVVPSSYIEFTGAVTPPPASQSLTSAKSTVDQNRMEEMRLTKEALKASKESQQVGPGMPLPERGSSRTASEHGNNTGQQRSRHESGRSDGNSQSKSSKSRPDGSKVRTWTDRSKSFSVEAQFLGLKDGKIHLHKMNGVKIAVPIAKMSHEDLEYVEKATGISLDDEKPLADVRRSKQSDKKNSLAGATVEKTQSDYDWFQFFLSCEVAVGLCERYAQAFAKDSMDESVLPDVDAAILRNLGLREGDIIKVMRTLDAKYGRNRGGKRSVSFASESGDVEGGLFSGPGGALRNNTRKGRPAPAVQTSDVVDAAAFSPKDAPKDVDGRLKSPSPASPPAASPQRQRQAASGFDDDAWDVKPSKAQPTALTQTETPATAAAPTPAPVAAPAQPTLSGSMKELSLLTEPLQPTKTEPQPQAATVNHANDQGQALPPVSQPQLQGATPSFFSTVPQTPLANNQTGSVNNLTSPQAMLRQRPTPPQMGPGQGSLVPPPPQRPLSAPQSAQPSAFAPPALSPQMTGSLQSQVAPPGQSLHEITQARLQQQYLAQMQQQQQPSMSGYPGIQPPGSLPFSAGSPGQFMQPMMTGMPNNSPFADPSRSSQFSIMQPMHTGMQPQSTGFQSGFPNSQSPFGQAGFQSNMNGHLPPALEPQRTGMPQMQPQATGIGAFGQGMQAPPTQPLVPQKTGPPPPVRFGVTGEKKLVPQPTGKRANLSQATPDNPFGF